MTVTELIDLIEGLLPADAEVVLSKDAEGNGFSPLYRCTVGNYEPESTYSGEFTEASNGNAVALWPVN